MIYKNLSDLSPSFLLILLKSCLQFRNDVKRYYSYTHGKSYRTICRLTLRVKQEFTEQLMEGVSV